MGRTLAAILLAVGILSACGGSDGPAEPSPQPTLVTLNTVVINSNGGTAVINDFQAKIDGNNIPWGIAQSVGAGSFIANEDLIPFYVAGIWGGDCAADGRVTLGNGESKTCSITYDDNVCVPVAGMTHWWPGDGTGTDVIAGLDAAVVDGAGFAPGLVTAGSGQAFQFDGVDAIAQIPNHEDLNPTVAFSAQAWARPGASPTFNGAIIGTGRNGDEVFVIDHHAGGWRAFVRDSNRRDVRFPVKRLSLVCGRT